MQEEKSGFLVKYHIWFSAAIGVAFLVVLQTSVNPRFSFTRLVPWLIFLVGAVFLYNKSFLTSIGQYSVWKALRIPLLILAGSAAFLVAPSPFLRALFLLSGVVVITFFESAFSSFSENLLLNEILFSAFALFLGSGGFAFLYTPQNRFYVSLGVFAYIVLLSRCFFEYAPVSKKTKLISSLGVGLLISEMFWAAGFLPQHFSAVAIFLLAFYNLVLVMNFHYFFNNLDFRKIQFHIMFAAACIVLVFLFTPWQIIN